MKDIPFFPTEYGVASLNLSQIPYRQSAYILPRTVQEGKLQDLIAECAGFCRAAGADHIFYAGDESDIQPHSRIIEMRGTAKVAPELVESLFPVTEQTVSRWRQIHNECMASVDHAAFLAASEEKALLSGGAYFIHRGGELLGIGWLEGDTIRAVASVIPGMGQRVLHTLMSLLPDAPLRLEVASTNTRAIALYEKNGFIPVKNLKIWVAVQ